jgi:hypothetical protein
VLAPDPGSGPVRISISVPPGTEAIFRRVKKGTVSRELRRIIRARLEPGEKSPRSSDIPKVTPDAIKTSAEENRTTTDSNNYKHPAPASSAEMGSRGTGGAYVKGVGWARPLSPLVRDGRWISTLGQGDAPGAWPKPEPSSRTSSRRSWPQVGVNIARNSSDLLDCHRGDFCLVISGPKSPPHLSVLP